MSENPYLKLFSGETTDDMAELLQIIAAHSEKHGRAATLGIIDHAQTLLRHELIKMYDRVIKKHKTANLGEK